MSPTVETLLEGNKRFCEGGFQTQKPLYETLASEGQSPQALVITCSDSRVLTDDIFDSDPGTCFVIRNIGGFVLPYRPEETCQGTTAAIDFAVGVLKVKAAIVLTHAKCAGVAKASSDTAHEQLAGSAAIANWLTAMDLPKNIASPEDAERLAARYSLRNLSQMPSVKAAKEGRTLDLAAMRFDVATGKVELLEG